MAKRLHHTSGSNAQFKTQISPRAAGIYELRGGGTTPREAFAECWGAVLVVKMMERVRMECGGRMPDWEPLVYT